MIRNAENERLPLELGWSKKSDVVTLKDILTAVEHIRKATDLITGNSTTATQNESSHGARDLHFGL